MDYQQKILVAVTVLLVALAIYFTWGNYTRPVADNTTDLDEVNSILMKGVEFGTGFANYTYSYKEVSDGYETRYMLVKNGNGSMVEVKNPLSTKKIYFLENETIFCIKYSAEEKCSSVRTDTRMNNYLNSIQVKFFSDDQITKNSNNVNYLIGHGYLLLQPTIEEKTVDGSPCKQIEYTLDYNNISLAEAARFGIGSNSPKLFAMTMCVDDNTGHLYQSTLTYEFEGRVHASTSELISLQTDGTYTIIAPENMTNDAVDSFYAEREQHQKMAACYTTKSGNELDICIQKIALNTHRTDLCEYAGSMRDRCLVSIVPLTKDEEICTAINDQSFKDDCYTELAGAYKNNTYCESIQNMTKVDFCNQISTPVVPVDTTGGNQTNNVTNNSTDVGDLLNWIEEYDILHGE
ncbi:hypothetical protein KKG55_02830 [Candidatus Micrarchaeota archaeon]|nr:hypothetical protein [Candidatus Micrarchaeota archaeon]MBU1886644.1 hypothetical protein [Candidatus Micrarchaeota archaeon]